MAPLQTHSDAELQGGHGPAVGLPGSPFPHSNRYSEDLDFNGPEDTSALKALWRDVVEGLEDFGIVAETRNSRCASLASDERVWDSDVGYSFDVSFQGPLHDGRDHSKGKVRADINQRQEQVATHRELVSSAYDDVRPFVVKALALDHLLADKLRALLVRRKPRDVYDIWLLLTQGVQPDLTLVERKLALYDREWEHEGLEEAIERLRAECERDLRPLLPQFVPYEVARERVESLLLSARPPQ